MKKKPNHGFRILDSQLLMRFTFLLAYADIFFGFSKTLGEETHAPQSPKRHFRNIEMVNTKFTYITWRCLHAENLNTEKPECELEWWGSNPQPLG